MTQRHSCSRLMRRRVAVAQPPQAAAVRPARLLVLNKEDATFAIVDPASGRGAGHRAGRTGTARARDLHRRQDRVRQQLRHRSGAGPHDLDDRHRRAEGTAPHRRRAAEPAARPRVRERQAVFHRRSRQEDRALRSGGRQDRLAVRDRPDGTHMVLPTKDARTIFTSNIGSDSISMIEQGAGGTWTQTVIPVGKGPEGIDLSPNGQRSLERALARRRRLDHRRRDEEGRPDDQRRHEAIEPHQADAGRQVRARSPISRRAISSSSTRPTRKEIKRHRARQDAGRDPHPARRLARVRRGERRQQRRGHRSQDAGR